MLWGGELVRSEEPGFKGQARFHPLDTSSQATPALRNREGARMLPDHASSSGAAGSIPGSALEGSPSNAWQFPPASQMPSLPGNQHSHDIEKLEKAATPPLQQGSRCLCGWTAPR